MLDQIKKLEEESRKLEPSPLQRNAWNTRVQQYADDFLDGIYDKKAFNTSDDYGAPLLHLQIGEEPKALEVLLPLLQANVDGVGLNPAASGHFGYVPGGGVFPAALGDYLAAVSNRYAGIFFGSPGAVRLENQLIRWMCNLIGYPEGSLGNLASGGSIANLIAITTARDFKKIQSKDVENAVIYLTHQVHHCVQKALRIAGLREAQIHYVPMDAHFRMDAKALEAMVKVDLQNGLKPFLIVASAGTTDTGAIDPLNEIADIAEKYGLWFHVDAAYGGFFLLVDDLKHKFKGIERSDSLAIDPHKGLFLPYGIGAILVKNVEATFQSHHYVANYMQDALKLADELSPADLSPELTKHFRGLRMWLPLHLLGLKPFKAALEEKIWLCRYFYEKVQELGFEVGPYPDLSIMIYRYVPKDNDSNEFNEKLVEYVQHDGRVFLSSTMIDGIFWIRLAVLCFRSHLREVDLCLEILKDGITHLQKQTQMNKTPAT
ncbi:MAG: aminotransferase class V-fold PLP-dependent enzyme [Saprospiraceae bacterium]|nr:aminotransferase class V-fold PLP-dependent enzyme [Saprospiraceae bacterium]